MRVQKHIEVARGQRFIELQRNVRRLVSAVADEDAPLRG
jgi:hypothetical protein